MMVGIHGIGGIGKTTIVCAVYNAIVDQFEAACYLFDVRERSYQCGLVGLQETLLSKLIAEEKIKVENVREGIPIIKRRLCQKKVLLILDDVNSQEQLEAMAGGVDWFGYGSRIIITTRDKHLLDVHGVKRNYEVKELCFEESLELFSWNTFKKNEVDPRYASFISRVVKYCNGLPLALEIIGSNLFGKTQEEWKYALDTYEKIPDKNVQYVLKLSYISLEENEREIFLDIACFFDGYKLSDVKNILLKGRGYDPSYCIRVLVEKSLIRIDKGHVKVHNLMVKMGREIVRSESPSNPRNRSRLWNYKDIRSILKEDKGSDKIEFLMLNMPQGEKVQWNDSAFQKMKNLKILIIGNASIFWERKHLPSSLKVLGWKNYSSSTPPLDFHPRNLRTLNLRASSVIFVKRHKICFDKPVSDATISKPPAEESSSPKGNLEMIGHLEGSRLKDSEAAKLDLGESQGKLEEISAVLGNMTDDDDPNPLVSHCFLFLSSNQFTRDELVILWIAEGLLQSDHFDRVWDVAYAKFDSLVSQEIIVPSKAYQFQNLFYHTVDNLLYEVNESKVPSFEDSLPVDGYLRVTVGDLSNILESEKVLHLSLICENIDEKTLKSMKRFKHLHTLFLVQNYGLSIRQVPHPLFLILNNLRSLNLSGSLVSELPSSVGCLKSLWYFDLSRTPIRKLPNSIENLQNLQILKLWDCLNLFELPKGMGKLTNLRHLGLDVIGQLKCMAPGMGNLTKLRSLSAFIVGRNEGCQIGELKSTRNLTGAFCISKLENVLDYEEAKTADLINKFISKLELCWTNVRVRDFVEEEKILEHLQPQLGLQELRILCYGGSKFPSWIDNPSYASLVDITLYNFKSCRHLPAFGRLPSLRFLHLKEMNELKRIDHQFYGNGEHDCVFPKLEKLTIQGMPTLEEWTGIKDGDLPSLYKLKVENIPKLMSLPLLSCLCSLRYLELSYCPNIVSLPSGQMASSLEHLLIKDCPELSKRCSGSESQDWIKIAHVPNIIIDDEEINSKWPKWRWSLYKFLKDMQVTRCQREPVTTVTALESSFASGFFSGRRGGRWEQCCSLSCILALQRFLL